MEKFTDKDPETKSMDIVEENIEQLKVILPEAFTEDKIDFEVLKQLLGGAVDEREEKYGLNWHGKRNARLIALTPSSGTLRPCPEESVDWDKTQNIMIEGDNLEVLKLLQKSYAGKIKLICIDPPYNTGNDFVYPDDFQDNMKNYLELTGRIEKGRIIESNTETSGRYHTDWLNMMYPRLKIARNLLSDQGLILIHIDEHEQQSLTLILREIFGEENELGTCIWDKRNPKGDARGISYQHESIILFARNAEMLLEDTTLKRPKRNGQQMLNYATEVVRTSKSIDEANNRYREWLKNQTSLTMGEAMYDRISLDGRVYRLVSMAWPNKKKAPDSYFLPLIHPVTGKPCPLPARGWRNPPETMKDLMMKGLIEFGPDETTQPQRRYYLDENLYENISSIYPYGGSDDALLKELGIPFDQPKPVELTKAIVSWCSKGSDIILDFFAGSGTLGHAVMSQNIIDGSSRRYILVQLPEQLDPTNRDQKAAADFCDGLSKTRSLTELTKERLRRAAKKLVKETPLFKGDLGFRVFKLDSSNIREWEPNREDMATTLVQYAEHLKTDRNEQDILYELLIKLGLDLAVFIDKNTIINRTVYSIGNGVLLACLAEIISRDDVEPLAKGIISWHKALAPVGTTTCIFRDSAFEDDVAKTNMTAILEQNGLPLVRSL